MRIKAKKFPVVVITTVLIFIVIYHFAYLIPFTNNAFVVANVRPVAANVTGYITDIYVQNEQGVKKGQPLFTVFRKPYALTYKKAADEVEQGEAQLQVLKRQVEKTEQLIQAQKQVYERVQYEYQHNLSALKDRAVSQLAVNNLLKERNAAMSNYKALETELAVNKEQIKVQMKHIATLKAQRDLAKVDLDETTVYAMQNGAIQNMFVGLGTPIEARKPVFAIADTNSLFIQANFNETDLRRVRPGDKVSIFPRMYIGSKIYHGVILSRNWAASRVDAHTSTQIQIVRNSESNWFLLPQRLPVQIRIIDYDPVHYPLSIGTSAYVFIHTW
jgi:multidrug resistance efflux pump